MNAREEGGLPEGNDLFRFARCLVGPDSDWLDLGCNQGQFLRMVRRHKVRAVGFYNWDAALRTEEQGPPWEYRRVDHTMAGRSPAGG